MQSGVALYTTKKRGKIEQLQFNFNDMEVNTLFSFFNHFILKGYMDKATIFVEKFFIRIQVA